MLNSLVECSFNSIVFFWKVCFRIWVCLPMQVTFLAAKGKQYHLKSYWVFKKRLEKQSWLFKNFNLSAVCLKSIKKNDHFRSIYIYFVHRPYMVLLYLSILQQPSDVVTIIIILFGRWEKWGPENVVSLLGKWQKVRTQTCISMEFKISA